MTTNPMTPERAKHALESLAKWGGKTRSDETEAAMALAGAIAPYLADIVKLLQSAAAPQPASLTSREGYAGMVNEAAGEEAKGDVEVLAKAGRIPLMDGWYLVKDHDKDGTHFGCWFLARPHGLISDTDVWVAKFWDGPEAGEADSIDFALAFYHLFRSLQAPDRAESGDA